MTDQEVAIVAGVGLLAFYVIQQNKPGGSFTGGGATVTWDWPNRTRLMGMSDGTDLPSFGMPNVSQAGSSVPGGGASSVYSRPIAPRKWVEGGSPNGWNAGLWSDVSYPSGY